MITTRAVRRIAAMADARCDQYKDILMRVILEDMMRAVPSFVVQYGDPLSVANLLPFSAFFKTLLRKQRSTIVNH